jgi:hypothetical protein
MTGGHGAHHSDCGTSPSAKAVVMDYNPGEDDTISGNCKLVNIVSIDTYSMQNTNSK